MADPAAIGFTCDRCAMTLSWMPDVESPVLPSTWSKEREGLYCLHCRRERAGEAGVAKLGDDAPAADRQKLRTNARVEFEIGRDPERPDNRIAKVCRTSVVSVRSARGRMNSPLHGPTPGARPPG